MLVLSRRQGENLVRVTVISAGQNSGQVRLAIEAPRHIPVDREEIRKDKERAA